MTSKLPQQCIVFQSEYCIEDIELQSTVIHDPLKHCESVLICQIMREIHLLDSLVSAVQYKITIFGLRLSPNISTVAVNHVAVEDNKYFQLTHFPLFLQLFNLHVKKKKRPKTMWLT